MAKTTKHFSKDEVEEIMKLYFEDSFPDLVLDDVVFHVTQHFIGPMESPGGWNFTGMDVKCRDKGAQ